MERNHPDRRLEQGKKFGAEGNFRAALEAAEQAIILKPDDPQAWLLKGASLFSLNRPQEALEAFQQAIILKPDDPQAWGLRGASLNDLGRHQDALEASEQAIKLKPDTPQAWIVKGAALFSLRRRQEALEAFQQALSIQPDNPRAWLLKGLSLFSLDRHQEALEALEQALSLKPDNPRAWYFKGLSLNKLGRHQEAFLSFDEALRLKPDDSAAYTGKLAALDQLEEWLKAQRPPKPLEEAYKLVASAEEKLHLFLRQRLQQAFGSEEGEWWAKAVPLSVRQKCVQRREEDPRRQPAYHYTDLLDLGEIMDKNWRLFEPDFKRVRGEINSKKEFLGSLVRLNEVRKGVMHPVRGGLTEQDLEFARKMRAVVEAFVPPG